MYQSTNRERSNTWFPYIFLVIDIFVSDLFRTTRRSAQHCVDHQPFLVRFPILLVAFHMDCVLKLPTFWGNPKTNGVSAVNRVMSSPSTWGETAARMSVEYTCITSVAFLIGFTQSCQLNANLKKKLPLSAPACPCHHFRHDRCLMWRSLEVRSRVTTISFEDVF